MNYKQAIIDAIKNKTWNQSTIDDFLLSDKLFYTPLAEMKEETAKEFFLYFQTRDEKLKEFQKKNNEQMKKEYAEVFGCNCPRSCAAVWRSDGEIVGEQVFHNKFCKYCKFEEHEENKSTRIDWPQSKPLDNH